MQHRFAGLLLLAAVMAGCVVPGARAGFAVAVQSPVSRVVSLLGDLKSRITADGATEKMSYDKFACWCEDTLTGKAAEISTGKQTIESLQDLVVRTKAELTTHAADIVQLKKDIAANKASRKEATELRNKETGTYVEGKTESEQCIGALEAAINVLQGAGATNRGFLETMKEVQLLSVVAGVRGIIGRAAAAKAVSGQDLQVIRHFVERPEDFVARGARDRARPGLSAAQVSNNPFADYAPQSTRVQGVLKGLYDSFAADLERANAEEAVKQKSFEELMATKVSEFNTLELTLQKETADQAAKTKKAADSKMALDDAMAQLEADEELFAVTKSSCSAKAQEWAQRTRLRTEELFGISKAVAILSSPEAQRTFHNATTSLLQLSAVEGGRRTKAYDKLKELATEFQSIGFAEVAVTLRSGGHFDKVIATIERMVKVLEEEEQADIKHRDKCQKSITENTHSMEDLNYTIDQAKKEIGRLEKQIDEQKAKAEALTGDVNSTKNEMSALQQMRVKEKTDYLQAVRDDADAVLLLDQAIAVLSQFYKTNGITLSLVSAGAPASKPEYDVAPPEPAWQSGLYSGRQAESGGILAILTMIKEDLEAETQVAHANDLSAGKNYKADLGAMQKVLDAQTASSVAVKQQLADLTAKKVDLKELNMLQGMDLATQQDRKAVLTVDCAWVETHFVSRRDKRKTEMDGLVEAMNYLRGVNP